MRIVNCTPHEVTLMQNGRVMARFAPCGIVPRVALEVAAEKPLAVTPGIVVPLRSYRPGPVTDLPDPEPGTWYIVSRAVAEAVPERRDLIFPDQTVRDENGRIIGCEGFGRP